MRFRWKKGEKRLAVAALEEAIFNWRNTATLARMQGAVNEAMSIEADVDMAEELKRRLETEGK